MVPKGRKKSLLCVGKEKKIRQNVVGNQNKSKIPFSTIQIILVSALSFANPSFLEVIVKLSCVLGV